MGNSLWQYCWIALAVLFALYGLLVRSIGSGTGFFIVWLAMSFLALLFAAAAHFHLWSMLPGWIKVMLLVFIVVAAGVFIFVEAQIISAFKEKPEKDLDYLVVLGAQIHETGPSVVLRYRLDTAREYLEENEGTLCIVTGGQGYNEPYPEAVGMKDYLITHGVDEERIFLETESENTKENLENAKALFDPEHDRVGIVTNNFHVFRALSLARKADIRECCGIPAGSTPLYLPNNMLREFLGVVKDYTCGNL